MALEARRMTHVVGVALSACFFVCLCTAPAHAEESLDPTFGQGGIAFPGPSFTGIRGIAQDAQGRLITGGATASYFAVARYLPEGSLDPTFGVREGYVLRLLGPHGKASAVALQRNGKVIAVGSTRFIGGSFAADRFTQDGRLDPSFGRRGRVSTPAGRREGGAKDVAIQPNGRIVAVGYGIGEKDRWAAMVVAYRPNGELDKSFGSDGILRLKARGERVIELSSIVALPAGKLLVAGDLNGRVMLIRLRSNGRLDRSFGGGDGKAFVDADRSKRCICSYATDLALDRRGRIVVSANAVGPRKREPAVLIRYRPNGKLDRSFGRKGMTHTVIGNRLASKAVVVQGNGKILLAGTYNVPESGEARVAVVRYLPNGKLDRSFAKAGFFIRDFGAEGVAYAALLQRDGRAVIAGRANPQPVHPEVLATVYDTAEPFLIRFLPN